MGGSPQVFGAVGHWVVVGARQVVVWDSLQVDLVVVPVCSTHPTWGLVEGIGKKKMRAGQHPVAGIGDEAVVARGAPVDGAIFLCMFRATSLWKK